jgi:hypothetical protein
MQNNVTYILRQGRTNKTSRYMHKESPAHAEVKIRAVVISHPDDAEAEL